jgi:hypothetical protein
MIIDFRNPNSKQITKLYAFQNPNKRNPRIFINPSKLNNTSKKYTY